MCAIRHISHTISSTIECTLSSINLLKLSYSIFIYRWYVPRDHEEADLHLFNDYFCDSPVYKEDIFRRRFRMHRHVFVSIVESMSEYSELFQQRYDACGRLGASPYKKCTAAMRMLAYGSSSDAVDEYLKIAASTGRECLLHFVEGVIYKFGDRYLRKPMREDVDQLLNAAQNRGCPGMMGSIDCMHWEWKNYPRGWKGMYQGRSKTTTDILEAVASWDLWIWHAFFETPGSCNDINVLDRSPVFTDILQGKAPPVNFVVNNNEYNMGYYLIDGIYPKWATFIPAIKLPQTAKHKLFTTKQESARKDVERAFGVLQARFAIIRNPALAWDTKMLWKIMMACIILHNMIVEDERHTYLNYNDLMREFIEDRPINQAGSSNTDVQFSTNPIGESILLRQTRTVFSVALRLLDFGIKLVASSIKCFFLDREYTIDMLLVLLMVVENTQLSSNVWVLQEKYPPTQAELSVLNTHPLLENVTRVLVDRSFKA
ncbi:uncharacterized protein [Spinacia oleracea]|uniref:DDE Tnp4 domain-containing protein n=1 Tax=Spinacia oleracea TaxID=3562 RepID=A0ABM3QQG0_SPIOL|nr:uncharacterized protein LOC130461498 [Spinacia oleracea]